MRMTKEALEPLFTSRKHSVAAIARTFGVSPRIVYGHASMWGLVRPSRELDDEDAPTIQEIKERAAEIRRGWTPEQRASRLVGKRRKRYEIPCYDTASLTGAADLPCYARI